MSSLGELYFQLGLDDKKFNDAIEAAKQKVKELGSDVEIGVKLDLEGLKKEIQNAAKAAGGGSLEIGAKVNTNGLENLYSMLEASKKEAKELEEAIAKTTAASVKVQKQAELDGVRKRIADQEAKILAKGGSLDAPKATVVKVELDEESINQVKARLAQLEHPITPKVSIEYDQEKFRAVTTTLENYTKRLNELGTVRLGIDDSFIRTGVGQNKKGLNGWLSNVSDYLLGDDTGDAGKSIKSIQKILDNYTFKVKAEVDAQKLVASISGAVKKVPVDINVDIEAVKKKLKQLGVPLNFNMTQAIADAKTKLKDQEFKAKLNLVIDKAKVSKVIKEAFAKKGLEYQATPSDVRNARILEIQQRMEQRQQKFNGQVKKSNASMRKLGSSTRNASDWAGQLSNQFNNLVSFYSLERFIRNLYTIGGEFQKQQIALQNMIGDVDRGNAIFERMKDLAVKSPFTFSDLASYTKQMSAYGIEYEELYDTTKRLADISAGVGVDMGRLILAFGQVRSAAVLRGQELRQFTEAGIPLVSELAKRFTELEGKAVSTGKVFDKISKREVSFGMVKDILFDMTDPGGRFFKMQEEQAKSLAGQWSNLKDAWDIMVADIANASSGALGMFSTTIKGILDTWRAWSPVLLGVVGLIGTYSAAIRIAELATSALNLVTNANPWVKVISVVVSATSAIIGYQIASKDATKTIEDLNVEFEKSKATAEDNERTANRYLDILSKSTDKEDEKLQLQRKQQIALEELTRMYEPLFKNMNLESMTLDVIARKRAEINEMTKKNTLESFRDNRAQMVSMKLSMERELAAMEKTNKSNKNPLINSDFFKSLGGKFNDWFGTSDEDIANKKAEILEITQAISDLDDEVKKTAEAESWEELKKKLTLNSTIDEYVSVYGEIGKAVKMLRKKGVTDPIADPKMGTSVIEYNEELNKLLKEQKGIMDDFDSSTDTYKKAASLSEIYKAAIKSIGGVPFSKKTSGKSEAEKAAERDAKAYLEALKAKLSELGSQWDLYKDLFEATGDKRLSMNIAFDGVIPNFDNYISHLKGLMQEEIQKRGLGISVADLLSGGKEGIAKRVNDKSQTAWTEDVAKNLNAIIDSYNNANKKLREESVRNFIDIIKNSKDFAQQIADIDRELQKDLSDLAKMSGGTDSELYNRRAEELIKRAEEEKTKVNFEEFKKSSDWVKVFDDLDRVSDATLDNMISKIEEFAKQAHLSEEVTKQLVDAMGKLRKESIERNPLQGFKDAWERLKDLKSGVVTKSGMVRYGSGTNEDPFTFKSKKEVDDAVAEANDDLEKAALAIAGKFNAVADAANMLSGVFKGFGDNLESFGGILNGIENGAKIGAGITSALGIAGPWGAIAGAALGLLSSAFEMHDKAIQKEIEASEARIKMIDSLADNLEKRLSSAEGGIYSISIDPATKKVFEDFIEGFNGWEKYQDSSPRSAMYRKYKEYDYLSKDTIDAMQAAISNDSYYSAQLASLKLQKDELNKQKNDLEEAKDVDETKIQDKITEIEQIEHEIAVFRKTMMDAIYGIDFKDWASQFTDAIVDAWAKGEDAADAYQKTVSNVMRNVAASVIQQSLIGKWLEDNMENVLALFEKNGGVVTDDVFNAMVELASGIGGKVEEVEQFMDYWEKALNKYNLSMKDLESTEKASSGLSKEIQGVTEDTANLLASYVNSIRQSVHVKQQFLEKLVSDDIPKMNYLAEAQLRELSQIQSNTARNVALVGEIRDLVNRVVDKGSNKLKV